MPSFSKSLDNFNIKLNKINGYEFLLSFIAFDESKKQEY